MWPLIIKAAVWVGRLAVENFIAEYAKKQASKIKSKLSTKKPKNDDNNTISSNP